MALRLIEMVLQEKNGGKVLDLLKEHEILEHRIPPTPPPTHIPSAMLQ
jgi:hypothetical protein